MLPNLTAGTIDRMNHGKDVSGAVVQLLGYYRAPMKNNYALILSDGESVSSDARLDIKLNPLVTNCDLEMFTIISVNKYVYSRAKKSIFVCSITVLAPGAEVGKALGNPKFSPSVLVTYLQAVFIKCSKANESACPSTTEPESLPENKADTSNNVKSKSTLSVDTGDFAIATNETCTSGTVNCDKSDHSDLPVELVAAKSADNSDLTTPHPDASGTCISSSANYANKTSSDNYVRGAELDELILRLLNNSM